MSSNFLCKICHKIRKDPIFLPCNCTSICREHTINTTNKIAPATTTTITCLECHKTFDIPVEGFRENKMMRILIESNAHLNENEKQFKIKITTNLEQIKQIFNDLVTQSKQFSLKIYEHFLNIKNEIDIRRETILEIIHDTNRSEQVHASSKEMIARVELIEETFRHTYDRFKATSILAFKIEDEEKRIEEFFRRPHLAINLIKSLSDEYEAKLKEWQRKATYFKYLDSELVTRNKFVVSIQEDKFVFDEREKS